MSFNQFKLERSVLQTRGIFNKYIYETTDSIVDVQAPDYFSKSRFITIDSNNTNGAGWEGGIIECSCSDGYVTGSISGSTLTDTAGESITSRVVVRQASDLSGTFAGGDPLLSTVEYLLDGIIDMGSQSIEVPQGGFNLAGFNFDVSKIISSEDNYTMFTSPASGSGNILGKDYAVEVTGTNSQVYDIVSDTGFQAFEFSRINYNDCTSLGEIDSYRQGLEVGTGRFGGNPTLTLTGTWVGGYFIDTSIVRVLESTMTGSLFEAGTAFTMASRFRSNQNIDLPAAASFFDFAPSNFINPSTVQIQGALVTRGGAFDATDSNITPNMDASDLVASWKANTGMPNTFEGGMNTITSSSATTIGSTSVFVDIAGTWTEDELQHFDSPSSGQLRNLGNSPREYKVTSDLIMESNANDDLRVRIRQWDDSASAFITVFTQARQVNALSGGRNIAFFTLITNVVLDQNDYIFLQTSNETATNDITAEVDSFFIVEQR